MRNLAAKVPEDLWPDFKARARAAYQAPSRAIARDLADGLVADYEKELPVTHRRATRTTNLLERLFLEERRRLKIIPNAFGEKAVLKLMFATMTRAAERWRAVKITDFERRQMAAIRAELDQAYEAQNGLDKPASKAKPQTNYPASLGLDRSKTLLSGSRRTFLGHADGSLQSSGPSLSFAKA